MFVPACNSQCKDSMSMKGANEVLDDPHLLAKNSNERIHVVLKDAEFKVST